jgi:hypothetical protein
MAFKLLSRDDFREGVFSRDNHKCVFCDKDAKDAHHIMERKLWPDGGYYLENGASVCEEHHILCEQTTISLSQVRDACGITKFPIPPHLYPDQEYDKWGNPVMPNGQRLKGDLFFDESVQKILNSGGFLKDFTHHVKYPRTYHLPWSENMTSDDRMIESVSQFEGRRVIVTEKMDGENTTWYQDYCHARSVDSKNHPSRNWMKAEWAKRCGDIPEYWRICLENLYAKHSIEYDSLNSYVMGYSIWNERNVCLDWDTTVQFFQLLDIEQVPVWYDGIWDEKAIRALWKTKSSKTCEGYVVRLADEFAYSQFRGSVAKFVRKDHVQPSAHHWQRGPMTVNKLKVSDV